MIKEVDKIKISIVLPTEHLQFLFIFCFFKTLYTNTKTVNLIIGFKIISDKIFKCYISFALKNSLATKINTKSTFEKNTKKFMLNIK